MAKKWEELDPATFIQDKIKQDIKILNRKLKFIYARMTICVLLMIGIIISVVYSAYKKDCMYALKVSGIAILYFGLDILFTKKKANVK